MILKIMHLHARQREILRLLWQAGPLSRLQLHQSTGLTPTQAGDHAAAMIRVGLLREGVPVVKGRGRPSIPLEIDPAAKVVVGLAIRPGGVEACRLNLRGELLGRVEFTPVQRPSTLVRSASRAIEELVARETAAIGVSATGFVDPEQRQILFSSALPGQLHVDVAAIYAAAGKTTICLHNDMHALAARWVLSHHAQSEEDVLLVSIGDGRLGAAMLIDGRPNRGCAMGGNELGHMRLNVETERCYCGQTGCLERICSTAFLNQQLKQGSSLAEAVSRYEGAGELNRLVELLAGGLANAVNFVRPARLVLVSEFLRFPAFADALQREIRRRLLVALADRVRIDLWDQPAGRGAETAGWLALASLCLEGWQQPASR